MDLSDTPHGYEPLVREAVIAFQQGLGIKPDGAVGPATRAVVNVPATEWVPQLLVNLEGWRWTAQNLGRRHVIVNIAGFRLGVVKNGEEVM